MRALQSRAAPATTADMTSAIVLAGGLGTRLRSAVPDLPKPMAPIAGRPFLEHQLDYWIGQSVRHFVLSVGYRHEAIRDHFGDRYRGATLAYAVETTPLGTGGALLLAARQLPDDAPVLLLNGDTYFAVELAALQDFARQRDADWCFSLFRTQEEGRYMGVEVAADGRITDLRSGTGTRGRLANGGVYLLKPAALRAARFDAQAAQSLENDIFPALFAAGQRFVGYPSDAAFIDIGVPDDYRRAATVLPGAALPA
jgi:D-glycero-alpha-D-manno-heptose 1-phosphate guanylyltransferase